MISIREARQEALRNARNRFFDALCVEAPRLAESLRACNIETDEDSISDLLQRARAASQNLAWLEAPLHRFEAAMLASTRVYAALSARMPTSEESLPILWPDALALFNHFRLHTDESPDPNPLTRVVLCVQHTYRAWRKAQREHRDNRPSDGVPR
jgi:hypothetical protein